MYSSFYFLIVTFFKVRMFMQDHAVAQIKLSAEKAEKEEKEHSKKEQHAQHPPEADE